MEQKDSLNKSFCTYEETINECCENLRIDSLKGKKEHELTWKPFLRQLLVCSGVWVSYFIFGLNMGAPTVFIPQIRRESNTTDVIDHDMASWLSSMIPFAGLPCAFLLPPLTQFLGRRMTVVVITTTTFVGYIIILLATTVRDLFISEAMSGLLAVSCHTILPIIITEYTSPRYRGIFLTLTSVSFFWGILVSNTIGTFFYWKKISYLGVCCSIYVLVTQFFWHESPYWLASESLFEECILSHRFLKGNNSDAELEIQNLLTSQRSAFQTKSKNKRGNNAWKTFIKTIRNGQFCKPTLISLLMMTLYHSSGKLACTVHTIELIKRITQSESMAYKGMLILDGVTVFGMYIGFILSRFLKRRTLMIGCSSSGAVFLFIISLYLYLIKLSVICENSILSILLLTLYQISISSGPIILSSSIYSELVPRKFINYSIFAVAFYSVFVMGSVIKFSSAIFSKFGLHSAFLLYSFCTSFCTYLVYKYLPEIKDKTIQEIEELFSRSSQGSNTLISK